VGLADSRINWEVITKPGFQGNNIMSLMNIFGFAMSLVYLGIGIFLIISKEFFYFSSMQQIGLGLILVIYGCVRFYTALMKKRESEMDENDENE
jgi:ABC-type Fe3+ transport system permease subunit